MSAGRTSRPHPLSRVTPITPVPSPFPSSQKLPPSAQPEEQEAPSRRPFAETRLPSVIPAPVASIPAPVARIASQRSRELTELEPEAQITDDSSGCFDPDRTIPECSVSLPPEPTVTEDNSTWSSNSGDMGPYLPPLSEESIKLDGPDKDGNASMDSTPLVLPPRALTRCLCCLSLTFLLAMAIFQMLRLPQTLVCF